MKTLKEIHESQGGKLGYKVKCEVDGNVFKVLGYDPADETFFMRLALGGDIFYIPCATGFTLVEEPREIWVNFYPSRNGVRRC